VAAEWLKMRPILDVRLSFSLIDGLKINFCTSEVNKVNRYNLATHSQGKIAFLQQKQKKKTENVLSAHLALVPSETGILNYLLQVSLEPLCSTIL
jgi:hypothetical protein